MRTIIRYVLLTALRDRLFLALIGILVVAVGIANALSNTATIEQHEMALSFSATVARLLLAVGLSVFVCFHLRYAFDAKEIDVMLSRPISRGRLVVAYWAGFSLVALILGSVNVGVIALLQPNSWHGLAAWAFSLLAEMWILVAVAIFASVTLRSAVTSVMACLVIYIVGRMMGFFLATVQAKMVFQNVWLNEAAKWIIEGCAMLTPRLDLYAKTGWLVYAPKAVDWTLFAAQSGIIVPLLLLLTIADFRRREF